MPHRGYLCPACGLCAGHHSPVRCPIERIRMAPSMYCLDAMAFERGSHWKSRERRRLNELHADLWLEYQEFERRQARQQRRHRHDGHGYGREPLRDPGYGGHRQRHPGYDDHRHDVYGDGNRHGFNHHNPWNIGLRDPYNRYGQQRPGYRYPDDRNHGRGHRRHGRYAAPGYGRRDHRDEREPRRRSPLPSETDEDSSDDGSYPGSDSDSGPAPSLIMGHGGHGRHGGWQPRNPFPGHRHHPRAGSDLDDDLPRGGHGNYPGGFRGGFREGFWGSPGGFRGHGGRRDGGPGGRRGGFPPGFPGTDGDGAPQGGPTVPEERKPDFYEVLGVPKTATVEECVKAARKKMIELHPDKHPEDREDPVKVKHWNDESAKVTEAQLTLGDAAKKARYDQQLRFRGML